MNRKKPWEGYSCLLPAFLFAHIFIEREMSGYEAASVPCIEINLIYFDAIKLILISGSAKRILISTAVACFEAPFCSLWHNPLLSVCKPSWNPTQRLVSLWLTVNWTLSRFRLTRLAVPQDFHNQNLHVIKRKDFEIKCVNDHLKLNSLIKQILSTYHLRQCMNISLENLDVDIYRVNKKKKQRIIIHFWKTAHLPLP